MLRLQGLVFGAPSANSGVAVQASYLPMFAHLGLVLLAGVYLPAPWWRGSSTSPAGSVDG